MASPNAAFEFFDNFAPVSAFTKSTVLSSISYFAKSASMSEASSIVFRVFMVSAVTWEGKETMKESAARVAATARWENGGVTFFLVVLVLSEETVLSGYVRVPIVVRVCVVLGCWGAVVGTRRTEERCKVCECFTGGGARVVVARPGRRFSWEDVFCSEGNFVSQKPMKLNRHEREKIPQRYAPLFAWTTHSWRAARDDWPGVMAMKRCSHGRQKHQCVDCNPCPHGKTKYKCVQCSPCPHGKLKGSCVDCSACPHGALKRNCAQCNPCPHGKLKRWCTVCTPCPHGRVKSSCAQCSPCPHGKRKGSCTACTPCPHGRVKSSCSECSPCPHGKRKGSCTACTPCPHGKLKRTCVACKSARADPPRSKRIKREPESSPEVKLEPEIKHEPEIKLEPEIKQEPFTIRGYFGIGEDD